MNRARNGACGRDGCWWVADATVTASCPGGEDETQGDTTGIGAVGPSVTVHRQGRSTISADHAFQVATDLARAEAEAELRCNYRQTVCIEPVCGSFTGYTPVCVVGTSPASQAAADAAAVVAADAAVVAFCAG